MSGMQVQTTADVSSSEKFEDQEETGIMGSDGMEMTLLKGGKNKSTSLVT